MGSDGRESRGSDGNLKRESSRSDEMCSSGSKSKRGEKK